MKYNAAAMLAAHRKAVKGKKPPPPPPPPFGKKPDTLTPGDTADPKKLGPHPGFQALVKSGVPAGALANAARNASPAAKAKNPRLNRVK